MRINKQDAILEVLAYRSLNTFEAREFGDTCLHSTISTLRALGHVIYDEWEQIRNRFGGFTRVKRYKLIKRAH